MNQTKLMKDKIAIGSKCQHLPAHEMVVLKKLSFVANHNEEIILKYKDTGMFICEKA